MARLRIKPASTNVVELPDVYDEVSSTVINTTAMVGGSVTGRLLSSTKAPLAPTVSLTWLCFDEAAGSWRCSIAPTVTLTDDTVYYAEAVFTLANGIKRTFNIALLTKVDDN